MTSASVILASEPQLFVSDMNEALDFYVGKLGFEVSFTSGDPTFYAQVARDAGRINLRLTSSRLFERKFVAREVDLLSATMALNAAEPLFREYLDAGVTFHHELRTEPWGARVFVVRDPDGNLIAFAGS